MSDAHEEATAALADLVVGLRESISVAEQALARAEQSLALSRQGTAYSEIAARQRGPLIVHLLTEQLRILDERGARFRAASARALQAEGLSKNEIAALFRVSRQRISVLINRES